MMRIETKYCGVVIVDPRRSGEEKGMLAGVEVDNIDMLHCSQLVCEVKIIVYDGSVRGV